MYYSLKYGTFFTESILLDRKIFDYEISDRYSYLDDAAFPLVINWGINGECQNQCVYCFSNDYRAQCEIKEKGDLQKTITVIKKLNPKVVVLSGGEPLLHPLFEWIVLEVRTFAEVIVDTNGILLNTSMIKFLMDNDVHIRVSLDSHINELNDSIRKSSIKCHTEKIKENINFLLNMKANFTLQTVLTPLNSKCLIDFGNYLITWGVQNWRVQLVVPKNIFEKKYKSELWYKQAIMDLKEYANANQDVILVRLANIKEVGKSIILISPDGDFMTRDPDCIEKVLIDNKHSKDPSAIQLSMMIDKQSHKKRYTDEII